MKTDTLRRRALAALVLGACLLLFGWLHVRAFRPEGPSLADGIRAVARLIEVDDHTGPRQPTRRVRYAFEAPEGPHAGQTFEATAEVAPPLAAQWSVGDYVDIVYAPAEPTRSRLLDDGGGRAMQQVLIVLADLLLLMALIVGWRRHRRGAHRAPAGTGAGHAA